MNCGTKLRTKKFICAHAHIIFAICLKLLNFAPIIYLFFTLKELREMPFRTGVASFEAIFFYRRKVNQSFLFRKYIFDIQ
jgi:hypothetical protein